MQPAKIMPKVNVSGASIDELKQELSGYVLQPGTPQYAAAVQIDKIGRAHV